MAPRAKKVGPTRATSDGVIQPKSGPWTVRESLNLAQRHAWWCVVDADGVVVCTVADEAHAHRIAASNEMLAALQAMLDADPLCTCNADRLCANHAAREDARAIIAQARGGK